MVNFFSPSNEELTSGSRCSSKVGTSVSSSQSRAVHGTASYAQPTLDPLFAFTRGGKLVQWPAVQSDVHLTYYTSAESVSVSHNIFGSTFATIFMVSLGLVLLASLSSDFGTLIGYRRVTSPSQSKSITEWVLSTFFASFLDFTEVSPFPQVMVCFNSGSFSKRGPD